MRNFFSKGLFVLVAGWAGVAFGQAPANFPLSVSAPPATPAPGDIRVFLVQGQVSLDSGRGGKPVAVSKGMVFQEGGTVVTGHNGRCLFVLSNGTIVLIEPDSSLKIDRFCQAPFDTKAEGTFLELTRDPSQSITALSLLAGCVAVQVHQLNLGAGSTFTLATPAGSIASRSYSAIYQVRSQPSTAVKSATEVTFDCFLGDLVISTLPPGPAPAYVLLGDGDESVMTVEPLPVAGKGAKISAAPLQKLKNAEGFVFHFTDIINDVRQTAGLHAVPPPVP